MKVLSPVPYNVMMLIIMSQLMTSCFSYRPLVKNQSSKSMDEIVSKIAITKPVMIKLKTGITVKMKIERMNDKNIYGTLFQRGKNGLEHRYENDSILISNIEKPMNLEITKISPAKLHRIKLKTGITIKMKIERLDDKRIYGTLFQRDLKGVERRYENDIILISNIDDIKVRKLKAVTTFAFVIPITVIAIAIAVTPGAAQAIIIH